MGLGEGGPVQAAAAPQQSPLECRPGAPCQPTRGPLFVRRRLVNSRRRVVHTRRKGVISCQRMVISYHRVITSCRRVVISCQRVVIHAEEWYFQFEVGFYPSSPYLFCLGLPNLPDIPDFFTWVISIPRDLLWGLPTICPPMTALHTTGGCHVSICLERTAQRPMLHPKDVT